MIGINTAIYSANGGNSGVVEQSDLSQDSFVGNGTSQFEIRVGDGAIGVVLGDKGSHDIRGPFIAPGFGGDKPSAGVLKPDTSHAKA